ncbi:MAG: Maf family protein, partial [Gammaproteobacteria bacterium]
MNSDRPLILASGSRYRRELLERLRIPFQVIPADIDETPAPGESGMALAARLGREKAASVAARLDRGLVIGSDQVAELEGRLLGKPGDAGRAFEQLRASSGKTVTFHTSLCVRDAASGEYHEVL